MGGKGAARLRPYNHALGPSSASGRGEKGEGTMHRAPTAGEGRGEEAPARPNSRWAQVPTIRLAGHPPRTTIGGEMTRSPDGLRGAIYCM